jgi:hypothetical protein
MGNTNSNQTFVGGLVSIHDRESCSTAIRRGGIVALLSASLGIFFVVAGLFISLPNEGLIQYLFTPWLLLDIAFQVLLALLTLRKSRIAATLLLIYFVLSKVVMMLDPGLSTLSTGSFSTHWVTGLLLVLYVQAMRGTYIWHAKYAISNPENALPLKTLD